MGLESSAIAGSNQAKPKIALISESLRKNLSIQTDEFELAQMVSDHIPSISAG
jgi:hypothetical protein